MDKKNIKKNKEEFQRKNITNPYAIVGFEIQKLFGYFDYNFICDASNKLDLARLTILYGLNGTGKTTILKLTYHLLSPEQRSGHKSEIVRTVFKKFCIFLLDGTTIWAEREKPSPSFLLIKSNSSISFYGKRLHYCIPYPKTAYSPSSDLKLTATVAELRMSWSMWFVFAHFLLAACGDKWSPLHRWYSTRKEPS